MFLKTDSLSCYTKNTLRLGTMSYLFWCPWSLAQCLAQSRRYYKCLCTTQKCAFFFFFWIVDKFVCLDKITMISAFSDLLLLP